MFAEYDENLRENVFLKEIVKNHSDIIKKAAEENWIICIPRSGTVESNEHDINTILDHVLIPQDDGILKTYVLCSTLSKKQLQVRKNVIQVDDHQFFTDTISILFKETFYDGKESKYTVWCIDKPLYLEHPFCSSGESSVLESLPDCIDFLWVESLGQDVLQQIQNLCTKFIETTINYEWEHIQTQMDLIGSLYSRCLQKALRNNSIREKASGNDQFLEKLKLAVETYMQYCLGKKIIFGISTFMVQSDAYLNKIIRNSENVSDKNLGISPLYSDILLSASCELSKLNNSNTILDKVNCLDRTFNTLCRNKHDDALTSDDLLQMFVSLILKVNLYNWVSNLNFIRDFKFCTSTFTEHINYLLTTLEAAMEYLKSNHFFELANTIPEPTRQNKIFNFIQTGNLASLKTLFENVDNNDLQKKLCHPLCLCHKCEEFTKSVLTDIDIKNEKDQTLLIYSTLYEQTEIVEYLLGSDVNVNSQDCLGKSALHYASERGYQDIILLLVSHKNINVNIQDNNDNTSLHLATIRGHDNCVKALIYSSSAINTNSINNCNETPLHLAAKAGYLTLVKILLENSTSNYTEREIRSVLQNCHNFSIKNYIEEFSIKKVLPSFAFGADKNRLNDNLPPESNFGIKPKAQDDLKKINLLINAIKNNDLPLTCFYLGFDHSRNNDVSLKCHPLCDCEKCQKILAADIESSVEDEHKPAPECELQEKINVNMCNIEGYTPLHVAAQFGRFSILRILLDCGALVNIQTNKNYYTPLHLACLYQQISIVKELVKCSNCNVNIRDYQGNSPLFYACLKNDSRIIEILIRNDADDSIKNIKGSTVWDICQKKMLYCAFKALKNNIRYSCSDIQENV